MRPVLIAAEPNLAGFIIKIGLLIVGNVAPIFTRLKLAQSRDIEESVLVDNRALEVCLGSVS